MVELSKSRRTGNRLVAIAVVLALALLATHAVSHWHDKSYDEDHCQVCHIGHAAIPQSPAVVVEQAGDQTARLAFAETSAPRIDFVATPSIPRAPPA